MLWQIGKQRTLCIKKIPSIQIKGSNYPTAIIASQSTFLTSLFKRVADKLEFIQRGMTGMLMALKAEQKV